MTTYSLTFKQIGGDEIEVSECRDLDAACDRVLEYLDYGYELIAAKRGSGVCAVHEIIAEVNFRIENPDWEEREEEEAARELAGNRSAYYSQVL